MREVGPDAELRGVRARPRRRRQQGRRGGRQGGGGGAARLRAALLLALRVCRRVRAPVNGRRQQPTRHSQHICLYVTGTRKWIFKFYEPLLESIEVTCAADVHTWTYSCDIVILVDISFMLDITA